VQTAESPVCASHTQPLRARAGRPIRYLLMCRAQKEAGAIPRWPYPALSLKALDCRVWVCDAGSHLYTLLFFEEKSHVRLNTKPSRFSHTGFGEEFSICSSFCFDGIWGGQVIHIYKI